MTLKIMIKGINEYRLGGFKQVEFARESIMKENKLCVTRHQGIYLFQTRSLI